MKILFPYVGDTFGGSHMSSLLLVKELLKSSNEILPVVALHQNGGLESYLNSVEIDYIFIDSAVNIVGSAPLLTQMFGMIKSAIKLKSFLKHHEINVVHTNDQRMHLTWLLACRLAGCKHVWHQRTICKSRRIGFYSILATAILTISEFCKVNQPLLMSRRSVLIQDPVCSPNDISDNDFFTKNEFCKSIGVPENTILISWIANWISIKRPLDFVYLAKILVERGDKKIRFLMFGEPRQPARNEVERVIDENGLNDYIFFMGVQIPIEPFIAVSDLLVATAENEGLGRTLIEAMSLNTLVVASDAGGHSEIIEDGHDGFLTPLGDVEAMADKIELALSKNWTEMIVCARAKAETRFSVAAHTHSILGVYDSL